MELSLLERLSEEVPNGCKNRPQRMRGLKNWVKTHESEIREALERSYTWKQITAEAVKMWSMKGEFEGVYLRKKETLLADIYYEVRTRTEGGTETKEVKRKLLTTALGELE